MTQSSSINGGKILLYAILILITFLPFLLAINIVDLENPALAYDWRTSFHGAIWMDNFGWGLRPFQTPPWSIWFLLPFTALPFGIGWAALMYVTTIALVAVVPRRPSRNLWLIGTLLLLSAHPVLRNFADVNLEGFVVAGVLLSLIAYNQKNPYLLALGVLLAGIKPQGVFLLYAVMGLYMLRTWHWRQTMIAVAIPLAVFAVTMLIWGQAWFATLARLPGGISLNAGLGDLGVPSLAITITQIVVALITCVVAYLGEPKLNYIKAGLLITASIMVAPYANVLSVVTALAFGGIGLFMRRKWLGVFIFVLFNLPYLQIFGINRFTAIDSQYFLVIQLILWGALLTETLLEWRKSKQSFVSSTNEETV